MNTRSKSLIPPVLEAYFVHDYRQKQRKGMPVLHPFGDENSSLSSNSTSASAFAAADLLMDNRTVRKGEQSQSQTPSEDLNLEGEANVDSEDQDSNISNGSAIQPSNSSSEGISGSFDIDTPKASEVDTGLSSSNSASATNDDSQESSSAESPQRRRMMLSVGEDEQLQESECRISDEEAIRCALSIPEEFVPTPHKDFLEQKERKMLSTLKKKVSIQDGGVGVMVNGKSIVVRERERKLRSAFAKYKKWDEAEKSKVEKLENNQVLVNGNMIIDVDHTNYIKEVDVSLPLDEDVNVCEMPELPVVEGPVPSCELAYCRLGCICDSIKQSALVRTHCGKPRCFFECTCQQALFANGDDGDIRSRLRPRVSLLNWRFIESTERDKDPPPANYRQLERGATIYPRMRRVPVAPQRFRNEYVMAHKFKDSYGRERRKAVTGITKFMRNKPVVVNTVKRDHGSIYRRNYVTKSKDSTSPIKLSKCKPCSVSIDPIESSPGKRSVILSDNGGSPQIQTELVVPPLIQAMTEDGQVLLLGEASMCFFAWTLHSKHPRAVLYDEKKGDIVPIPWLYVPIPSFGEAWIFHNVNSEVLAKTTFTYIPEINCVIPSKALQVHFNTAMLKKKTVALKILWIGQDSRKRMGSIYIFPELPGCLVCGPFPKNQMKTQYGSPNTEERVSSAIKLGAYIDEISQKRFMGDEQSWNTFFSSKSKELYNSVKENVQKYPGITLEPVGVPPRELFFELASGVSPKKENKPALNLNHSVTVTPVTMVGGKAIETNTRKPIEKLRVSWNDAARLYSVNSVRSSL